MEDEEGLFADNLENELLQESDNENRPEEPDVNINDADTSSSRKVEVKKRIVNRKPQVKLDPDRLCGPRGIPILPGIFDNVKFKGKNHEKEDLDLLMSKLEHWGHRLFPKLPFDEVIEKIEKLGSKKPVQVCIKKMRLDLPILNADFIHPESDDEPVVERNNTGVASDPFDSLLQTQRNNQNFSFPSINADNESLFNLSTTSSNIASTYSLNTSTKVLSDEIRERIERNKQLAMEKKRKAQERKSLLQNQAQSVENVLKADINREQSQNSENPKDALEVSNNVENISKVRKNSKVILGNSETVDTTGTVEDVKDNLEDDFDMTALDDNEFLAELDMKTII